jgi:Flp pilus assembly protein TadD
VILIGWDGADWSILDRLAASGRMPNWARLVREGRSARLRSLVPILSPIVWTSILTGATPEVHGVLDFQEIDPATGIAVPISGRSRRVPAVWNVASARGLKVGVVGWWATHPAEVVHGFMVSDRASSILFDTGTDGMAFPASLLEPVRRVMTTERDIPDTDLTSFVAMSEGEIRTERERGGGLENPILALKTILGATRTVQRVARDLYDREAPDFSAVYFEGTDAIGHVFAPDVPPRLPCVSDTDFGRFSGTVDAYYAMMDALLGQWMRRAAEDGATLVVCSDHGFKWGEDRTCKRSSLNWATAAFWHHLDGVLAIWGARVSGSSERGKARVMDIAPTLDALLSLPADFRMPGEALVSDFRGLAPPRRQDVFGTISVRRLAMTAPDAAESAEYAKKLRALGYLNGSESRNVPTAPAGARPGWTEGAWNNLGVYQRQEGHLAEAEHSFRESLRMKPDYSSPMFNMAVVERTRGNWRSAISWLFRSLDAGHAEPEQTVLQWVSSARESRRPDQATEILRSAIAKYPHSEPLAVELARILYEAKDCRGAEAVLRGVVKTGGRDSLNLFGIVELCLGQRDAARAAFRHSLELDPAQPSIREALALSESGG